MAVSSAGVSGSLTATRHRIYGRRPIANDLQNKRKKKNIEVRVTDLGLGFETTGGEGKRRAELGTELDQIEVRVRVTEAAREEEREEDRLRREREG